MLVRRSAIIPVTASRTGTNWCNTAGLVRSMLGVSPDAWQRAREAMGDINASITIAAILERIGEIRSPGGYLRALTDRAEIGQYSVLPVIKALDGEKRA